jgi:hypothetical protein
MAEATFYIVEPTRTPILQGDASRSEQPLSPEQEDRSKPSFIVGRPTAHGDRAVSWNDLYSSEVGRGALLIHAHDLLVKGERRLRAALDCLQNEDIVGADFEITLFQGDIPELFCCNSIGESFTTVVVALRWALKNRKGAPLSMEQLSAVLHCVVRLSKEMFLDYDTALNLVDALEDAGLNADVSVAAPVAELLIEDIGEHD